MSDTFTALVIEEHEGKARSVFKQLRLADLPDRLHEFDAVVSCPTCRTTMCWSKCSTRP